MQAKRSKFWTGIGGVLLLILLCFAGGVFGIARYQKMTSCFGYDNRPVLASFEITINASQQQQLVEQFQKFAEDNRFKFHLGYLHSGYQTPTPDRRPFLIHLERKDIGIDAINHRAVGEFMIVFYNNDCIHPAVASDIESLVSDLKSRFSEIPNAVITEK